MVLVAKADIATVMPEPARGAGGSLAPTIFGRLVNPIPTRGEQIIPTYYYWPPECFSPSGITELYPILKGSPLCLFTE